MNCIGNQLTGLDVSNNTALTYLVCGINQLTSLDVRWNTALTNLECYECPLSNLDVSRNTALSSLECFNNQLTSLDIRNCSELHNLRCAWNNMTTLDISGCPALVRLAENQEPEISNGRIQYKQGFDCLAYEEGVTLLTIPAPDFVLPAGLATLENEAFSGGAFTHVLVPAGVVRINNGVFANCQNLQYVEIQGSDTRISDNAFGGRTDITIIAPAGSAAATWAKQHDINVKPAA